ncbi:MAG: riboflavin synthase [Elusimicrobiota bacterium]
MFTGIVKPGIVVGISLNKLTVTCGYQDVKPGESVTVNGVCLTVTGQEVKGVNDTHLEFDISTETLSSSNLGGLAPGDTVNTERALLPTDRMGGHIVTGHIETTAQIVKVSSLPSGVKYEFICPDTFGKYLVPKGSIAVDGISLTVVDVSPGKFSVVIIPHTLENTALKRKKAGDTVNLEPDILIKYLANIVKHDNTDFFMKKELTWDKLKDEGFL